MNAARAAEALASDSKHYSSLSLQVVGAFMAYVAEATIDIPDIATQVIKNRAISKAATDYRRKDGRKLHKELMEDIEPQLSI